MLLLSVQAERDRTDCTKGTATKARDYQVHMIFQKAATQRGMRDKIEDAGLRIPRCDIYSTNKWRFTSVSF